MKSSEISWAWCIDDLIEVGMRHSNFKTSWAFGPYSMFNNPEKKCWLLVTYRRLNSSEEICRSDSNTAKPKETNLNLLHPSPNRHNRLSSTWSRKKRIEHDESKMKGKLADRSANRSFNDQFCTSGYVLLLDLQSIPRENTLAALSIINQNQGTDMAIFNSSKSGRIRKIEFAILSRPITVSKLDISANKEHEKRKV